MLQTYQSLRHSRLHPKSRLGSRSLLFTLTLTSLIDAFSILVIFLLMQSPSMNDESPIYRKTNLPSVRETVLAQKGVNIRIFRNKIYVEEQEVPPRQLLKRLIEERKKLDSLVIVADKASDYAAISPILRAGAQTGFENIKFAALPKSDTLRRNNRPRNNQ